MVLRFGLSLGGSRFGAVLGSKIQLRHLRLVGLKLRVYCFRVY